MFAVVIPLTIFVLPALLKKLGCELLPIELQEAGVQRALVENRKDQTNDNHEHNEDAEVAEVVGNPSSEPASVVSSEGSMESDRDKEMAEAPEVPDKDPPIDGGNEPESIESPTNTSSEWHDANGGPEMAASTLGRTSSHDSTNARRTNSRVASLRAAFEQPGQSTEPVKRRLNSEDGANERILGLEREHEAEIAKLRVELEKEKDLRVAYEERVTSLEEEIEELSAQLEDQDEALREGIEQRNQGGSKNAEDRVVILQQQLSELKRSMATSTRPNTQVSDGTFREELGLVRDEIQNWVVNNFRRVKVDSTQDQLYGRLAKIAEPEELDTLKAIYEDFDGPARLAIYQATAAHYLATIFDDPYLFGVSQESDWLRASTRASDALSSVLTPAAHNRWRAMTFDALRQCEGVKLGVEDAAQVVAAKIMTALNAITDQEADEAKLTSLKSIVKRAIDVAHLLRVQQARYLIMLPSPGDEFDINSMDDISEDNELDADLTVRCATFFSVVKIGDENGENPDLKNLIIKASVLVSD